MTVVVSRDEPIENEDASSSIASHVVKSRFVVGEYIMLIPAPPPFGHDPPKSSIQL